MDRKNVLVVSGVALVLLSVVSLAVLFAEGSLLPSNDCQWTDVPTPPSDPDMVFDNADEFISMYAEANADVTEKDLRDSFDFKTNETGTYYRSCQVR